MSPAVGTTLRRHRRLLLVAIAVILIVAISVVAVSCTGNEEPGPPTVTVDRGTVALAVSASGSIAPSGRQSLGFADGGTVKQVLVNVGDRVRVQETRPLSKKKRWRILDVLERAR